MTEVAFDKGIVVKNQVKQKITKELCFAPDLVIPIIKRQKGN